MEEDVKLLEEMYPQGEKVGGCDFTTFGIMAFEFFLVIYYNFLALSG